MTKKIYELLKLLLCLFFFFMIGSISSFILKIFGINVNEISNFGMVIFQFVVSISMFLITIITYYKFIKKDLEIFKKNIKENIKNIIKTFIIFMVVKYLVSFISVLIIVLLGFDTTSITSVNQSMVEDYVKAFPILMVITTSFIAPIYEELLFRLGIKRVIKNKYLFVILSGVIFGLLHIFPLEEGISLLLGIVQSISYVTMGIYLAYIYEKNDNIWMSIGVHFLNNFLSILVMISML